MRKFSLVSFSSLLYISMVNHSFCMMKNELPDFLPVQGKATLKLLAKKDDALAQYNLGIRFYFKKDYKTTKLPMALYWLEKAAENHSTPAQILLSRHYLKGCQSANLSNMYDFKYKKDANEEVEVFKNNFVKALKWAKIASKSNNLEAQDILGQLYNSLWRYVPHTRNWWVPEEVITSLTGLKGDYDTQIYTKIWEQAAFWYRLAADQDLPDAQFHMGRFYEYEGGSSNRNMTEAVSWYGKAARQGHEEALRSLKKIMVPTSSSDEKSGYFESGMPKCSNDRIPECFLDGSLSSSFTPLIHDDILPTSQESKTTSSTKQSSLNYTHQVLRISSIEVGIKNLTVSGHPKSEKGKEKEKEEESTYDSEVEYARHQKVNNRFFRRITAKKHLRKIIKNFTQEISNKSTNPSTPIDLDGLSSRTRILLFKELTTLASVQDASLPFIFQGKQFTINLKPSLRQPGDGIITTIGTYRKVFDILHIYTPEYQKVISNKLLDARRARPYHPAIPHPNLLKEDNSFDLEMLNILLDFEVARRLQGTVEEEKKAYFLKKMEDEAIVDFDPDIGNMVESGHPLLWPSRYFIEKIKKNEEVNKEKAESLEKADERKIRFMKSDKQSLDDVPVASAIVGALKLSTREDPVPFEFFVHAPNDDGYGYNWGEFNAFEGRPDGGRREEAVKRIIKNLRGANTTRNGIREQIHQEYLEIFGGESESDGETYESSDEEEN